MQIKILWVGKTKNASIRYLFEDYLSRIGHMVSCEVIETRDFSKGRSLRGAELLEAEASEIIRFLGVNSRVVALDERGIEFSSAEFARWFAAEQNKGTREIAFVIGGPEGLGAAVFERTHLKLSLGRMTWTHEICRLLLIEQIYRALGISWITSSRSWFRSRSPLAVWCRRPKVTAGRRNLTFRMLLIWPLSPIQKNLFLARVPETAIFYR
jgi:23S rRNA (pseudouridine1915-N3)-methyltransferase